MTSPDTLRVIVFEGVQNLALYAAQTQGRFAAHGLDVQLSFTPNSWTLRDGLQQGSYDIAHTAVDNAIAMVELAGADVAVVMGGDNGFNGVYVQPDIADIAALRGRTVLVDAPNTAFALVLYRILSQHGMERSRNDYVVKSVGATPLRLAALLEPSPLDQPKYAGGRICRLPDSSCGPGLQRMPMCCNAISAPMSKACAGHLTPRIVMLPSTCWPSV